MTSLMDDFLSDLDTTSVFYFPLSTSFSSYCRDDNISNDISAAKRKKTKSKENSSMMGWVRSSLSSFLPSILLCFNVCTVVNLINVKRTSFSYERLFWQLLLCTCNWKKLPKWRLYEKREIDGWCQFHQHFTCNFFLKKMFF